MSSIETETKKEITEEMAKEQVTEDEGANEELEDGEITDDDEEEEEIDNASKVTDVKTKPEDVSVEDNVSRKRALQELESDEEKKRRLKEKLAALELQMAAEDETMGVYANHQSPGGYSEEMRDSDSGSSDRSSSPHQKRKKRKKEKSRDKESRRRKREDRHRRREREKIKKTDEICHLYMQGKCPKSPDNCMFSHDADPPKIFELCKFYLFERCAKREKCLYLHKGFPCKYFHTGMRCLDTAESCKFSHEPLEEETRTILLKHLESAPKEILGDFPRMTREHAVQLVTKTEGKNKGWNQDEILLMATRLNGAAPPHCRGHERMIPPPRNHFNQMPFPPRDFETSEMPNNEIPSLHNPPSLYRDPTTPSGPSLYSDPAIPAGPNCFAQTNQQDIISTNHTMTPQASEIRQNVLDPSPDHSKSIKNDNAHGEKRRKSRWEKEEEAKPDDILPNFTEAKLPDQRHSSDDDIVKKKDADNSYLKRDPRVRDQRSNRDPRKRCNDDSEKEKRIMEMDLGSVFGDLELPTFKEDDQETNENNMGLPFKPYLVESVAKEIDASYYSHSPINYHLQAIHPSLPDYSDVIVKHHIPTSQIQQDPRLQTRKKVKTDAQKIVRRDPRRRD